ncbi:MAG: winged helix-turn-helix transcriptional regulator [Firmicutes bacterium]|nr:winged helix-turn-helix transcriptional regulator [Bacillota bacterium]
MSFPETFKALADPIRRDILVLLKGGSMSAGEIGQHFNISGATISYHLSQLKKANLVFETKYKNFVYYELNISVFEEVMLWLAQFKGENNNEHKR